MQSVLVTAYDLDRGIRGDHARCPLALAIRRQTRLRNPSVGWGESVLSGEEYTHTNDLARHLIRLDLEAVEPFRVGIDTKEKTICRK